MHIACANARLVGIREKMVSVKCRLQTRCKMCGNEFWKWEFASDRILGSVSIYEGNTLQRTGVNRTQVHD